MNYYDPGTTITLSATFALSSVLANPTTVTLTITPSSGVPVVFSSPTNDSAGVYHQDYTLPADAPEGVWKYKWAGADIMASGFGKSIFGVRPQ